MKTHYEVYRTFWQWRWRLVATNGEIIASGEGYWNKADYLDTLDDIRKTSLKTPVEFI